MKHARSWKVMFASIAACACALVFAGPASAAVFTVDDLSDVPDANTGVDPYDGVCNATGAETCTLRAALDEANATNVGTDTVNVSLPGTISLAPANGQLSIFEVTIVNGNASGTTIDAGGTSRVLSAFGSAVTLNDVRLQNGAVTDADGAGIFSNVATLTLNRVSVTDNDVNSASGGFGGAGIMAATNGSALVLNESTVDGNTVIGTAGLGGGIRTRGPLTLNRSTVSDNAATLDATGRGGGIDHGPTTPRPLNISNSTISGNDAGGGAVAGGGGAVFTTNDVTISIVGSTIVGNTTTGQGGALRTTGTQAVSENTIYAGNTATVFGDNCAFVSTFVIAENNIESGTNCNFGNANGNQESVTPAALGLGPLASNGGLTQTHSIASGSVAQNAASADCGGLTVDQRGIARPQGATCDIGAFEQEVAAPLPPDTGPNTVTPDTTPVAPTTRTAPKRCTTRPSRKKGQKLKKGRCVKKKAKKKK